jgi:hypothetical protein
MFLRMLWRAAVLRRGRAASALLAMVVAAAVATAMLNLYVDVQAKLRREFRKYGANVVVVARDGQSLPDDTLTTVRSALGSGGIAVPFAYAVARTPDGRSVVVAWNGLPAGTKAEWQLVVGNRVAERLPTMRSLAPMPPLFWAQRESPSTSAFRAAAYDSIRSGLCRLAPPKIAVCTCPSPTLPSGPMCRIPRLRSRLQVPRTM